MVNLTVLHAYEKLSPVVVVHEGVTATVLEG